MVGPSREGQLALRKPDLLDGVQGDCKGGMWGGGVRRPGDLWQGGALESVLSPVTFLHPGGVLVLQEDSALAVGEPPGAGCFLTAPP